LEQIQAEAMTFCRQNPGSGMTVEQYVARALDQHPEVYATFRLKHDSAPLVAALERAGLRVTAR
jgi:hypothetical protein